MEEVRYTSTSGHNKQRSRQELRKLLRVVPGGKHRTPEGGFDPSALENDSFLKSHYLEKKPASRPWLDCE